MDREEIRCFWLCASQFPLVLCMLCITVSSTTAWQGSGGAPDVVYAFTPAADVAVDISTCGSLFDTQLYVVDDPQNMQARACVVTVLVLGEDKATHACVW
jgi:hypothetical protein